MTTIADALAQANQLVSAGRLEEAAQLCRTLVAAFPRQAEVWHLLGSIAFQRNQPAAAAECFAHAAAAEPWSARAHYNLGLAWHEQRAFDRAAGAYRRAIELDPSLANAHNNLGNVLNQLGQPEAAIACFRRALAIKPDLASAHNNLGAALMRQGNAAEAVGHYTQALELKPEAAETHYNLAQALRECRAAPGAGDSAAQHLSIGSRPDLLNALLALGNALYRSGRRSEAAAFYRQAIALDPGSADAYNNLGGVLREMGEHDQARQCFERAIELQPNHAGAHANLALELLLAGDYDRGWSEFEWRWQTGQLPRPGYEQPVWTGESLQGRTILLEHEQGWGDTIQFIRYAPLVKQLGATVVLKCPGRLLPLLGSCPGIDAWAASDEPLPAFDCYAMLASLPGIFRTTVDRIPANVPYLFADPNLVAKWHQRLAALRGLRVGVNWRGRGGQGAYRERDIPLEWFLRLARLPGTAFVSLQRGEGRDELRAAARQNLIGDPGDDVDVKAGAFADTAAIMVNLDLVITSDTAIAHLAGALGVRVWVGLPKVADWRWLTGRSDSPWYPTMRLFRQRTPGDWGSVFDDIERALRSDRDRTARDRPAG